MNNIQMLTLCLSLFLFFFEYIIISLRYSFWSKFYPLFISSSFPNRFKPRALESWEQPSALPLFLSSSHFYSFYISYPSLLSSWYRRLRYRFYPLVGSEFIRCFRDVQLLQKLLHLQLLQPARLPFPSHIPGWEQRQPLFGGTSWQVHNRRRKMPSMLSLKLCLDLLRLFFFGGGSNPSSRGLFRLGRFLCRFPRQLALLVSIRFRSQKAPIPQLPNDYLSCCFGDTFSWHRYSSFYFYAGRAGKKVCLSFRLSTFHHPLFMFSFPLRFPFLPWYCLGSMVLGVCWF